MSSGLSIVSSHCMVSIVTKWCGNVLQTQPHLITDSCPLSEAPMLHEAGWRWIATSSITAPVWSARSCWPDGWWGAWRPCVASSVNGPLDHKEKDTVTRYFQKISYSPFRDERRCWNLFRFDKFHFILYPKRMIQFILILTYLRVKTCSVATLNCSLTKLRNKVINWAIHLFPHVY